VVERQRITWPSGLATKPADRFLDENLPPYRAVQSAAGWKAMLGATSH
jgi:hypothetical protein